MKTISLLIAGTLAIGTCTIAFAAEQAQKHHAATTTTTAPATQAASQKPINQYCAVEQKNKIDPKVTTIYKGQVIGFCCEDCIKDFNKDPEKYMKTLK